MSESKAPFLGRLGGGSVGARPPAAARWLGKVWWPLEGLFRRLFGATGNPLDRAGAVAVVALAVSSITGIYLFLFYRIGDPYGSVLAIQEEIVGGAWVRAIHRYSANLCLVAAAAHLVRKLVSGHTWGPRALAWVTGGLLLGVVLLTGWTGLVMAWDAQGLAVASQGAKLLDALPVHSQSVGRLFSGEEPVPSSFFFMNLFLHVALPLGLAALLWLHTSRLARSSWLPSRKVTWGVVAALALVALLLPLPLGPPADPLALPGPQNADFLYSFWLPLAERQAPAAHLALWALVGTVLLSAPWWWRPRRQPITPSRVDEARCTGCEQCAIDCPYEAIGMVPREGEGRRSLLVARVDPTRCVGCGICVGSCAPMGVGPAGRDGREQLAEVESLAASAGADLVGAVVLLACGDAPALARVTTELPAIAAAGGSPVLLLETGCSGSVHTSTLELLLRRGAGGVAVLSCGPGACLYREGPRWLHERVFHDREAELKERVDRRRVALVTAGPGEAAAARQALLSFCRQVASLAPAEAPPIDPEPCARTQVALTSATGTDG
jgi:ferredoxin/coenzyme F420-reducing hydrogenase delta subunit